jgi:chromosomal replication initiation ATPase DnaA
VEAQSPAEWEQFRRALRGRVTPVTWQTWLAGLEPHAIQGGVVSLIAPSEFHRRWVNDKFRPIVEDAVSSVFGPDTRLVLDARPALVL